MDASFIVIFLSISFFFKVFFFLGILSPIPCSRSPENWGSFLCILLVLPAFVSSRCESLSRLQSIECSVVLYCYWIRQNLFGFAAYEWSTKAFPCAFSCFSNNRSGQTGFSCYAWLRVVTMGQMAICVVFGVAWFALLFSSSSMAASFNGWSGPHFFI